MYTETVYEICIDCADYVANGELPECDKQAEKIKAGIAEIGYLCLQNRDTYFSRHACDCCNSKLGGDRFSAVTTV